MLYWKNKGNGKTKVTNIVIVWLFAIATMAALVVAQDSPTGETAVLLAQADPLEGASVEGATAYGTAEELLASQAIQSITFNKDMTVKDALRFLALKYHKNIVPTSGVDGPITIVNLYDVTFEEALSAIIGVNKYEVQGNFIMVYTADEYEKVMNDRRRMEYRIFTLYYVPAAEVEKLIMPLLSELGQVATTSAIAINTGGVSNREAPDNIAIRDRLVVMDYPENIEKIEETIESVDIMPPQILLEVTMLEAKLDETTEFGIDFDSLDAAITAIGGDGISIAGFATGVTTGGLSVGIVEDHVRVFIRALESITDTTVLANPKILALNKQAGVLLIGEKLGYLTTTTVSDGGTSIQEVAFLEVGTRLAFRPFICNNGYIRMEINPKQSEGTVKLEGGLALPEETTTEIITNIMVKDGQTIVIGGLFREKTVLGRSQVPILGDLPIIGEAFRSTNDKSIRTELIILITPHIINYPEQANGEGRMQDVQRIAHKARKNITWLSRARRAEDRYTKAVEYYSDGNLDAAMAELNGMWESNRGFLEVERLRERIIAETQPENIDRVERIMLGIIEQEESQNWLRR